MNTTALLTHTKQNQVYLKQEYGSGYRLSLAATPQKLEAACR
jgi:hypothetical protein